MKVLKDLAVSGSITVGQFLQSSINTDKFLVSESGVVKYRSGSQLLGDIGAAASGHTHTFASLTSKPTTLSGYGITDAVNTATTITINGTTYDLSANRSWTVTTSETDTLASVMSRGNTTSGTITFNATYSQSSPFTFLKSTYGGGLYCGIQFIAYNPANGIDSSLGLQVMNGSGSYVELLRLNGSAGTASINGNTILHAGNYNSYSPTLTGSGATGTWSISITGNSATLGGYGPNQTGGANTIVQRDSNGYIQNSYFYTSGGGTERNSSGLGYIAGFNSSDYYIRSYNSTAVASFLGLGSMAYASTGSYLPLSGGTLSNTLNIGSGGSTNAGLLNITGSTHNQVNITHGSSWGMLLGYCNEGIVSGYHGPYAAAIINVQDGPLHLGTNNSSNVLVSRYGQLLVNAASSGYGSNLYGYNLGMRGNATQAYISVALSGQTLDTQGLIIGIDTTAARFHVRDSKTISFANGDTERMTLDTSANLIVNGSVRAPIFYDSQDTGYYCDPNGTSRLNTISSYTIYNTSLGSGYYFTAGSWGWRHQTPSGYIEFGPANGSYAHIYTDRGNFYFNVDYLYMNGNRVYGDNYRPYADSSGAVSGLTLTSSANGINPDSVTQNQIGYNTSVSLFGQTDGGLYSSAYSSNWIHQIYGDFRTGQIAIRGKLSGTWQAWRTVIDSGNIGSQSVSYASNAGTVGGYAESAFWRDGQSRTIGVLNFSGVGGNSGNGNQSYAIYQEGGAWSPPFPDLCIGYHTGIKLGAYYGYNGIRFFNNSDFATQTFSVNDGDNHVRVAYNLYVGGTASATSDFRAPRFYDSNDTAYYLDPNGTSNLYKFSEFTMAYNGMNPMSANSPYAARYAGSVNYRNGTMGSGTTDFNVMASNWGSGFIDSWSSPGTAPGGSSHYVGLQGMHYNYQNSYNFYGFQMACAGEADNRFFWRSAWPTPRAWVEMIHTGNIGGQSVNYASSAGSVAWSNVSGRPTTVSSFSNDSGYITSGANVVGLYSSGFGGGNFTWYQSPGGLQQYGGSWASFLISNHGDGATYYNQTIIMPFWGVPQYMRKEGGTNRGPYTFWTTENYDPSNYGGNFTANGYIRVNANNNLYLDYNYGCSIVGVYSSYRYQGVFSMGDAYKLAIDGTTPGNLYGMAWSHPNAGGQATRLNDHGLLVMINGVTQAAISSNIWAAGDVTAYSDSRVKTNVKTIENPIEKVLAIRGVTFNRTDLEDKNTRHAGVIAQEVLEVLPEVVTTDREGMHSVAYGNMAGLFIEAIKEQQKQIEELKNKLDGLTK